MPLVQVSILTRAAGAVGQVWSQHWFVVVGPDILVFTVAVVILILVTGENTAAEKDLQKEDYEKQ